MDCSPPGSSVHGILQATVLEWATISSFRDLSNPGIELQILYCWDTREVQGDFTNKQMYYPGVWGLSFYCVLIEGTLEWFFSVKFLFTMYFKYIILSKLKHWPQYFTLLKSTFSNISWKCPSISKPGLSREIALAPRLLVNTIHKGLRHVCSRAWSLLSLWHRCVRKWSGRSNGKAPGPPGLWDERQVSQILYPRRAPPGSGQPTPQNVYYSPSLILSSPVCLIWVANLWNR